MSSPEPFRHPRYVLRELLGEGGMGRVYLADDVLAPSRPVALKIYRSMDDAERLRAEFAALRRLRHPGIARALDFGVSDRDSSGHGAHPFFTMERVEGESLADRLARNASTTTSEEAEEILERVILSVAFLHRRGLLHLDIKPPNILVPGRVGDPWPVLIDFGLVRARSGDATPMGRGTLPFAAPEIFRGEPPTAASDVYSLAATFYSVLGGRPPVTARSVAEVTRAHREDRPIAPLDLPGDTWSVISRALLRPPAERYADAGEFLAAWVRARRASPRPRRAPVFSDPAFVGRTTALRAAAQWRRGRPQTPPLLAVVAPAGFGKTRFLDEVSIAAQLDGAEALTIRCGDDPTGSLVDRLVRCARCLDGDANSASTTSPGHGEKVGAVLRLLRRPLLFMIDDLHLADGEAVRYLLELAAALRLSANAIGGIVVSFDEARIESSELRSLLDTHAERCALGPFSRAECEAIDVVAPDGRSRRADVPASLRHRIHRETGGHPLLCVHALTRARGGETPAGEVAIDLAGEWSRLGTDARVAALTLAVLDRVVSPDEFSSYDNARGNCVSGVNELERRGLVVVQEGELRLVHASLRDAALAHAKEVDRRATHTRVAANLEARREDVLLELAWHRREAGDGRAAASAVSSWIARPTPLAAWIVPRAVELLRWAADAGSHSAREQCFGRLADLFEARGRYEEAADARREQARRTETRADPAALVTDLRRLASTSQRAGRVDEARKVLERCVREGQDVAPAEVLRAHAELALLHHFAGRPEVALRHAETGIGAWQRLRPRLAGCEQSAVDLYSVAGQIFIRQLRADEAIERLRAGLAVAESSEASIDLGVLLNNFALALHLAGDLENALAVLARADELARVRADILGRSSIRANTAQILAKQGHFHRAAEIFDELLASPAVQQSRRLGLSCRYTGALIASLAGDGASVDWESVRREAEELGDAFLAAFARLHHSDDLIAGGRYSDAREVLAPPLAAPTAARAVEAMRRARLDLACALSGMEPSRARVARDALEAAPQFAAWNDLYCGIAAMERGRFANAARRVQSAIDRCRAWGLNVTRFEALLAQADLELRRGAAPEAVSSIIDEARAIELESHRDRTPRQRGVRLALLDARCAFARLVSLPLDAKGGDSASALIASIDNALSRAIGDPQLSASPDLELQCACLRAARSRLDAGARLDPNAERRLGDAARAAAARLAPRDRSSLANRDPWSRFQLGAFRRERHSKAGRSRSAPVAHDRAIAEIARLLPAADDPAEQRRAFGEVAEGVGAVLGADRVVLHSDAGSSVVWKSKSRPSPHASSIAAALARFRDEVTGAVLAVRSRGEFARADDQFLALVARLLAPHLSSARVDRPGVDPPTPALTEWVQAGKSIRDAETAALESGRRTRTRRLVALAEETGFVAGSRAMRKLLGSVASLAQSELPVLITGESGTGKDCLAKLLHLLSPRAASPYVTQSCSAIPPHLFEADLFGYERGAFTGADESRTGFLFRAGGGTFHLEEIGDLAEDLQTRLLRVLEGDAVRPVGSTAPRKLDVRFIASTHRDIDALLRSGRFRRDLYFRLSGGRIQVPPLRQRLDDLPALVDHYWRRFAGESAPPWSDGAIAVLRAHRWPGNVRELISVLRRLSVECAGEPREREVAAALDRPGDARLFSPGVFEGRDYEEVSRQLEESYLEHLLDRFDGDMERIANHLRKTTRSVYRRFERLGLKPTDFERKPRSAGQSS